MGIQNLLQADTLLQITPGRLTSIVAGLVGLISVIIGGIALARSVRRIKGVGPGGVALVMGLIGVAIATVHLGSTTGGFGTGKGRAGAIVAIVIGLIGIVLGALAVSRSRRITTGISKERR